MTLSSWNDVAVGVLIHRLRCGQRSFFAEVDEGRLAVMGAQQQESATAKISGDGMHDGKRESGGHGSVDGIASLLHNCTPASEAR